MTSYELADKLLKIGDSLHALTLLQSRQGVIGMDQELIREEIDELIRHAYDDVREFESNCVSRGFRNAVNELKKMNDSCVAFAADDFLAKFTS